MDLVIMAAGMGSRFGGLKQIEPVNDNGEFILDYSIYDAIRAGFDRVLFIIKKENLEIFRETVGKRIENKIKVEYVFQEMKNIPVEIEIPAERTKPLGTGHAIYCIKDIVSERFAVINADDFYGRDAFDVLFKFLKNNNDYNFATVNYKAGETMSDNGSCKRGVCVVENGKVKQIVESKLEFEGEKIKATPLSGDSSFYIEHNTPVSMNILGLNKHLFDGLVPLFSKFLKKLNKDILTAEFLLPDVLAEMMKNDGVDLISLKSSAKWQGITYKEDKEKLVNFLKEQTEKGIYPKNLWW